MGKIKTSLEYDKSTHQITLCTYEEGFLLSQTIITDQVVSLALEKLYDDYGLDDGDELHIKKKMSLNPITKIGLKK